MQRATPHAPENFCLSSQGGHCHLNYLTVVSSNADRGEVSDPHARLYNLEGAEY